MARGPDQALDVSFHQYLHDRFGGIAQEIRVTGFRQQLDKG